jgi:hypothetical protein
MRNLTLFPTNPKVILWNLPSDRVVREMDEGHVVFHAVDQEKAGLTFSGINNRKRIEDN